MELKIDEAFRRDLSCDAPIFDHLMSLSGTLLREKDNRKTFRFTLADRDYVAKVYREFGWLRTLTNLFKLRRKALGARPEWRALIRLRDRGIPVPEVVAYGERGWNPVKRRSFVIMKVVREVRTLEDLCASWKILPPESPRKRRIVLECARIVRILHECGINHRDLYICHFFLRESGSDSETIYLYDLHRAQVRKRVPRRWIVKDLAGLYYSVTNDNPNPDALPTPIDGLNRRDLFRFLKAYFRLDLRELLSRKASLLAAVLIKAEALRRKGTKG